MTSIPTTRLLAVAAACGALVAAGCGSSEKSKTTTSTKDAAATTSQTTTTGTTTGPSPATVAKQFTKPKVSGHAGAVPSQLNVVDVKKGKGETIEAGDTAIVNYVGADWRTGKEFDSSWSRKQPLTIKIDNGSVIAGWWQGIPGMKVGGRRTLTIPSDLGYGKNGSPPSIKPNEPLYFVVDLLGVQKAQPPGVTQSTPPPAGQ